MHHLWVMCRIRGHSTELSVRGKIEMRRLRYVDKSIYLSLAVMTRKARGLESHCGGPLRVLVRIWCRRGGADPRPGEFEAPAVPLGAPAPKAIFPAAGAGAEAARELRERSVKACCV